ncbi:Uncharacterised protein [Bordetella pertussis]|nr:Uncharacterised protein [Bordetella pertussis]CFP59028.1 Uncharacterised protein [Bordetella pertussis]CFW32801.1 Uncharacterised protein [Bordetella pertussis]CPL37795.1 Uncharacterised protein [Bordetella pertussis]CPN27647.1 Uncharacterised protein [Bordetella pertussis]
MGRGGSGRTPARESMICCMLMRLNPFTRIHSNRSVSVRVSMAN